ncbi:MAG: hypothetical protein HY717_06720 [Planctomycetes bacterium]|nr:hypothetical protein [Planctomycetota bacterium]
MKNILLITKDPKHRVLYETGLKKHFQVQCEAKFKEVREDVEAIILDIPGTHRTVDLEWVNKVQQPVVVLTPEDTLPLPPGEKFRVLTYPVDIRKLLNALSEVGVKP